MSWRKRVRGWEERINGLSLRERAMLMVAVLAIVFLFWDAVIMSPIRDRQQSAQEQLGQVRDRVAEVSQSIQVLARNRQGDPEAALRTRQTELRQRIGELEARLQTAHSGISSPRHTVDTLARLLADRPGLALVELENLAPTPLTSGSTANETGIWVHRVRLLVDTRFEGALDYLALIEALPEGVYWESLTLDVPDWPTNRVELILYSLALDDAWLGI